MDSELPYTAMICLQLLVGLVIVQLGHSDLLPTSPSSPPLETRKQWNVLQFNLPWDFPATDKQFNDPEQVVATGIAVGYERIFVATPRLFSGVAATLSTIPRKDVGDSPVLEAYPSWAFHTAGTKQYNCSDLGLTSVYRVRIDSCDRLWALDAGKYALAHSLYIHALPTSSFRIQVFRDRWKTLRCRVRRKYWCLTPKPIRWSAESISHAK